jgi:hypothetical protein
MEVHLEADPGDMEVHSGAVEGHFGVMKFHPAGVGDRSGAMDYYYLRARSLTLEL